METTFLIFMTIIVWIVAGVVGSILLYLLSVYLYHALYMGLIKGHRYYIHKEKDHKYYFLYSVFLPGQSIKIGTPEELIKYASERQNKKSDKKFL
jgi:uncharacterized membrane protein YdjX (TVP38/TMEM64 family)